VPDSVSDFFDDLSRREHEPLLAKAQGTLRFDLTDGKKTEHWLVAFTKGGVSVSRKNARADSVFRTDSALFGRIVRGEANAMTAVLRGEAYAEGDLALLFLLQRVFPEPARRRKPQRQAARARRRA
jgi:putative sterol carrier protein